MFKRFVLLLGIAAAVFLNSSVVRGGEPSPELPSAEELIRLAPKVTLNDPHYKTFHLKATLAPAASYGQTYEVWLERPGRFSMLMSDSHDQTPYVLAVDGNLWFYDAIRQRVILGHPTSAAFVFVNNRDNELDIHWSSNVTPADDMNIDLKSIFSFADSWKVSKKADGTFALSTVSAKGTHIVAQIDRSKACPLTHIDLIAKDGKETLLSVELAADQVIPDSAWRFPSADRLAAKLPVVKYSDWENEPPPDGPPNARSVSSLAYRAAFSDLDVRRAWEDRYGKTDWERAKTEDAKITPMVRKLISEIRDRDPG